MPPRGSLLRGRHRSGHWTRSARRRSRSWRCAPGSSPSGRRLTPRASSSAAAACCPASRTRTSTSPPGRSGCGRPGSRERARVTRRSSASRRRSPACRRAAGCAASAGARATGRSRPTCAALDRVTGAVPAALMSKDYHSLWVNSAALERADGPLELPGGVVERDADGRPAGILRENAAWSFRDRYVRPTLDGDGRGLARGDADRRRPRRDRAPRQGRLARVVRGAPAACSRTTSCSCASGSRCRGSASTSSPRSASAPASATTCCGSATSRASWTARSARRRRCSWTARASRSRAARRSRTWCGAPPGRAGRSRSTRSATAPTAPHSTPSRRPATSGSRAVCGRASSTPSCSRPRSSRASPRSA